MGGIPLQINQVFRYGRPYRPEPLDMDGYVNYFHATHSPNLKLPLLERGINPVQEVKAVDGSRRPAILISSSPHKLGSRTTPWQDFFDPDNGHIRYCGDNKDPMRDPAAAPGNRILLQAFKCQSALDPDERRHAVPIGFFKRVARNDQAKGYVQFQGFGIIRSVQLVTQYDRRRERAFSNYAFDFTVFSLAQENEVFDWSWLTARRDPNLALNATLVLAPASWRKWIAVGPKGLEQSRRRVSKLLVQTPKEQKPALASVEEQALNRIYNFYTTRKARFEALAEVVAARVVGAGGGDYMQGWITPASSDGGADFIGRYDVGSGLALVKLVVLGQAKCEHVGSATGGRDIARTVARLKRGWIGVYVTTSYFSEAVQREVIEDDYPIVMIGGGRLALEVLRIAHEQGYPDIEAFLNELDQGYEGRIQVRRPEEILLT